MIQVVILDLTRQFRGGALYPVRFYISTLRLELLLVKAVKLPRGAITPLASASPGSAWLVSRRRRPAENRAVLRPRLGRPAGNGFEVAIDGPD